MAIEKRTEIVLDHKFDPRSCRHYLNGELAVLHCHHYATLYTQLALDCSLLDARALLAESAEDSFYDVLTSYFDEHDVDEIDDRFAIAEQYYAVTGLGRMNVRCAGVEAGEVELLHSHIDEGWIKKWGVKDDEPVNFITAGYIAAMFAAAFDRPPRSYAVTETQSIAAGADTSVFAVVAN